jgi:hypothetical protein
MRVERHEDRCLQSLGERLDVGPGLFLHIGDRQLGADLAKRRRAAVGDRVLVGNPDEQGLLSLEHGRACIGHDITSV